MVNEANWKDWLERFYNLRRDKRGSHERPHKPVLLLAAIDLLDRGIVTRNKFELSPDFVQTFKRFFDIVKKEDDKPNVELPFFHLAGDGFWQLIPNSGGTPIYQIGNASGTPSLSALRQVHGHFDDQLWRQILNSPVHRHYLREALIARYFPDKRPALAAAIGVPQTAPEPAVLKEDFRIERDAAFRNTILKIYDFTCCACGLRVKVDDLSLVDAAHLIPFEVTHNDRPDNGLALCPNHHRAMDRRLIAPCPDRARKAGVWKIAKRVEPRIAGHKDLVALHGQPVIPPGEEKFLPSSEGLAWREERLNSDRR